MKDGDGGKNTQASRAQGVVHVSDTIRGDEELIVVRWRYDADLGAFDSERLESTRSESVGGIVVTTSATLEAGDVLCANKMKRAVAEERARLALEWKEAGSPGRKVDLSHLPSPHIDWHVYSPEGELVYVGENTDIRANHDVEDYLFSTREGRISLSELVQRARTRSRS